MDQLGPWEHWHGFKSKPMMKKSRLHHHGILWTGLFFLAAWMGAGCLNSQAQNAAAAPADGFRLEARFTREPEYGHTITNVMMQFGTNRILFRPPAGWEPQVAEAEKKLAFKAADGESVTLRVLLTNNVLFQPAAMEAWVKTNQVGLQTLVHQPVFANGMAVWGCSGVAATNESAFGFEWALISVPPQHILAVTHWQSATQAVSTLMRNILSSVSQDAAQ